jgi:hypothetical protein
MLTGRWYLDIIIVVVVAIIAIMVVSWLLGYGHPWYSSNFIGELGIITTSNNHFSL